MLNASTVHADGVSNQLDGDGVNDGFFANISFNNPLNKNIGEFGMYFGAVMLCALTLFLGCAYLLLRGRTRHQSETLSAGQFVARHGVGG